MVAPRSPRGREKITAVVRWLCRRENTFNFAGGRGGEGRLSLLFLKRLHNFSRLAMVIIRILQPFLCFFFHWDIFIYLFIYLFNVLHFYPITRFLVSPLLVTSYCVTLFSNKHTSLCVSLRASLRNDCILHRHKQGKGMSPAITNQADS